MIIYGDFNCPFSYLASRRAELLTGEAGGVDWRAVEHQQELPVMGVKLDDAGRESLADEWASVQGLLLPGEVLPGQVPAFVPNTQAAVAGYAEACGAGVGDRVRRLLFHAYWVDGTDIGNPEVLRVLLAPAILSGHSTVSPLRDFGYAVSVARGPITTAAHYRIRDWRNDWRDLGDATIPALVQDGGAGVFGIKALSELGEAVRDRVQQPPALEPAAPTFPPTRYWY